MKRRTFDALRKAQADRIPAALVTDLGTGFQTVVTEATQQGDCALEDEFLPQVYEAIVKDRSGILEFYDGQFFVNVLNPPLRMILVGAVHIAQALAPMASLAGYDVTVVDPRRAFATDERFPAIRLNGDWPDEALEALRPDRRTAIITLSHDPKLDDPALMTALSTPAFFIGALGSRKTHAARLERMQTQGVQADRLTRISGPVGLDIGAVTPAEIAISILAEVTLALRGGPKHKAEG